MTPSKELFELVKSLDRAEKGYFKKYAYLHSHNGQSGYLILFDAIAKQKEYDEKKLINQLQAHNFIKHLPYWKNYLYARILDALENYHGNLNARVRLRSEINRAEILQARGLYSHSARLVKKIKPEAKESDAYPALMDIYSVLDFRQTTEKYDFKSFENSMENIEDSYRSFRQNLLGRNLNIDMVYCYQIYSRTRNKKYLYQATQLIEGPLAKEFSRTSTFTGKVQYLSTHYLYWYLRNNLNKAYSFQKKVLDLFHENPSRIKPFAKSYTAVVNNLFVISTEQKKYDVARVHLNQLREAESLAKTHSQKAVFYYQYNTNLLHYLCQVFHTQELNKSLTSALLNFKYYEEEMSDYEKIELLMHFSISYYYQGNLKKCILVLNTLRNEYHLSVNPDIESFFYLFRLIAHYDAGNNELLSSAIQAFYRFLKKKENISETEISILTFLRKQSRLDSRKKQLEEFKRFKNVLNNSTKSITDKYIFKYIDLLVWLESKIQNRMFSELMKRNSSAA